MTSRIGTEDILAEKIAEALAIGAAIERTEDTVRLVLGSDELFWAMRKGDSDVWIFKYNDKYYNIEE